MSERHLTSEELAEYGLGIVDENHRAAAAAHLKHCSECSGELTSIVAAFDRAVPPEFPETPPAQVEQTWRAIVRHIEDAVAQAGAADARLAAKKGRVPGTSAAGSRRQRPEARGSLADWLGSLVPASPAWSWQLAKVAVLLGLGFGVAWFLAGRGWLPGNLEPPPPARAGGPPPVESTRGWLATSGYGERLETLLLALARGDSASRSGVTPTVRRVSRELLSDSRWYRRVADRAGDPVLAELLSEVEILLLAVATVPEGQEARLVEDLKSLIEQDDLLWRLRSMQRAKRSVTSRTTRGQVF